MSARSGMLACASAAALALASGAKAAPPPPPSCAPAAVLTGAAEVARSVARELASRGIHLDAPAGCPRVRAKVGRRDDGILLDVEDGYGRRSERIVSEPATAAILIESWARTELTGQLLAPPASRAAVVLDHQSVQVEGATSQSGPRASGRQAPNAQLLLAAEVSGGMDSSIWYGASVAGCVRFGALCAGALARVAVDSGVTGDSQRLGSSRVGADVLLAVDVPVPVGAVTVSPGAGFGVGWIRSSQGRPGQDTLDVDTGGLRVGAHLIAALPVARAVALLAGVAIDLAPIAHQSSFREEGIALAGEPIGYVRGSLGIRYGVP